MGAQLSTMDNTEGKALIAHIKGSLSTSRLRAAVEQARSWEGISLDPEALDTDPWLLNCQNGTFDLRTGTLRPHAQTDLLTKVLPIPYDPDATCPTWKAFLWRIMGGSQGEDSPDMGAGELAARTMADERARALIGFLQRAIGYTLTGSTREQCLFILHGPTKTGKSTFLATLRALLGPYGQQADMETFMHRDRQEVRNDLADLAGSRFVCALEGQEGKRLSENLVKQLTGGADLIKARFLFQEHFTYRPQFKVFLGTNHKPVVKDTDDAIWERLRLVPFTVQIPKEQRDKSLEERLQAELPGILAWAVRGCLQWQKAGELQEPSAVVEATAGYRSEMDDIGRFLTEACLLGQEHYKTKASVLLKAYHQWCGQTSLTGKVFAQQLTEKGYVSKRSGSGNFWQGIGLPSDTLDE
jgi:putative DNA primase/helicase